MSIPIKSCTIIKAALGDKEAFDYLVEAMAYNRTQFAFTIIPCDCDPPCPRPTEEQTADLNKRVDEAIEARETAYRLAHPERIRVIGNFDKWIFPVIKSLHVPWYRRLWNWITRKPDPYDLKQILLGEPVMKKPK